MRAFCFAGLSITLLSSSLLLAHPQVETTILGVDKAQEQNIRAQLSIAEMNESQTYSSDQIKQLHRRAKNEIKEALEPFGYYHATILPNLEFKANKAFATYTITLGRPTRVEAVKVQLNGPGENDPSLISLLRHFGLKIGDILDHSVYETSKKDMLLSAINQGYVHAHFDQHEIIVDLSAFSADIDLSLYTGQLYHLGPVTFESDYFDPDFLARFIPFEIGEVYHPEKILNLDNNLTQSPYFKEVIVEPLIPNDPEALAVIPTTVTLVTANPNQHLIGVGYDTNTGARIRLGWDRRYLNPQGHRVSTQAKLAQKVIRFNSDYIIPGKQPATDEYRLSFSFVDDEYQDRPSHLFKIGASNTEQVFCWNRTLALYFLNERFKETNFAKEHVSIILPSLTLTKVKRDNPTLPTHGYRINFIVRGGINTGGRHKSFTQGIAEFKALDEIQPDTKIIVRATLGAIHPKNAEDIPVSIRFFAGGDDSIRGFKYRSLPAKIDRNGTPRPYLGGAYLAIGSVELEQKVKGPISVATFIDGGSAFSKSTDAAQAGIGVGVRWATPIGPLKVDIAKPITNAANKWRLHINIGPEL